MLAVVEVVMVVVVVGVAVEAADVLLEHLAVTRARVLEGVVIEGGEEGMEALTPCAIGHGAMILVSRHSQERNDVAVVGLSSRCCTVTSVRKSCFAQRTCQGLGTHVIVLYDIVLSGYTASIMQTCCVLLVVRA